VQTFLQDIRYGVRLFASQPAFTAVALLSLAIGIGANTAVFSVANALLLRPLPYADAERLVILWNRSPDNLIWEELMMFVSGLKKNMWRVIIIVQPISTVLERVL
jgi:hypothetical protein